MLEIVSEPDLRSAKEAVAYMRKMHSIVRYLEISDGNMQEGSFRCDANVSVRPRGQEELGTRAELKNLNSFRFVEKAINFEIERQIELIEDGGEVVQETRLYDSDKDETRSMRSKEEANDYRYFPDPDLLPVEITADFIEEVRKSLPELPAAKQQRFVADYGIKNEDADILVANLAMANFYEDANAATSANPQNVANWVIGEMSRLINRDWRDFDESLVSSEELGELLNLIESGKISNKSAKLVLESMWVGEDSAIDTVAAWVEKLGVEQISDTSELESIVDEVIAANPSQVAEYQSGKDKLIGYFVGQVMQKTGGKANPGQVNQILKAKLSR